MRYSIVSLVFSLLIAASAFNSSAQTLIINEVSQGETGNQEYVEFVVVDTSVTYNCQNTTPPCIDIRGWIFDDNSGYHGSAGIATGAVRFSFNSLWACVPLGTVIVIYNGADPNPQMPPNDISLSDGNCNIVAPIGNTSLFESNITTPGAIACSYPASGWTPGGDWNTTLLANGGDCARIVDLAGCEVFSVCWGTNNQNNLIYFAGGSTSATSATNTVYYFNGIDPTDPSNWTIGCADPVACGVENQTPGSANNAANSAFIGQFNNNCSPITPLVIAPTVDNDATCICNGQASVTASGSIAGYTYEWVDNLFVPIGQTSTTATNLCAGTYNVIVTSSIGCADTAQVVIASNGSVSVGLTSTSICAGDQATLTAAPSAPGGTFSWNPANGSSASISVSPVSTSSYTVTYTLGSCTTSATATVTVNPSPTINAGADLNLCAGQSATLTATGASSYSWTNGITNGTSFTPNAGTTVYTVTGTDANGCTATDVVSVSVSSNPLANASFSPTSGISPLTVDFTNLSAGGSSYFWDFGNGLTNTTSTASAVSTTYSSGTYTITLTATNGNCQDTWTGQIIVLPGDPSSVEVPNFFTPNNDGINDLYSISSENLASLEGTILNRWGAVMLTFNAIDFSWDGLSNGDPASEGTYFIQYKAVGIDEKVYEGHTFFELVR